MRVKTVSVVWSKVHTYYDRIIALNFCRLKFSQIAVFENFVETIS